ncbi:MAG: cytochrome c [Acidimicrobiia bacterium]|nr:cytochrome c [Acidimicrobiia bacterium]MYI30945.1 cytochrome c [Acidimicrobiia bacterium]
MAWFLLVMSVLSFASCGVAESPEVSVGADGTPDWVLASGREVFVDRCSSCHDGDGSGTITGPRLNNGRLLAVYSDLEAAAVVVSQGRNGMPGFSSSLTSAEINAVLRYISEVL